MIDKINAYKTTSFQLNSYVVKGLKSLDLTMNELLLVLYLLNIKNSLDLVDIESKVSLSEEEVLSSGSRQNGFHRPGFLVLPEQIRHHRLLCFPFH